MLAQRVVTAVVMLAVLLAAVLAPQIWPLALILGLAAAATLWEWLRLTLPRCVSAWAWTAGAVFVVATSAILFTASGQQLLISVANVALLPLLWLTVLFWLGVAMPSVIRGDAQRSAPSIFYSIAAVVALLAAWLSVIILLLHKGPWYLVSLLALIWFADIAAYFCGKAFGRHKLAPRVSPGKTWEGAFGGVIAATVWTMASSIWPGTFGADLLQQWSFVAALGFAVLLAAISIVGDLFESLLKRRAGFKDSSGLLPGHGGVFDRIDALLPVAPLALLLVGV